MEYAGLIIKREKEEKMHFIYYFIRQLLNCTKWVQRKISSNYLSIILKVIKANLRDGCFKNHKYSPNNCY